MISRWHAISRQSCRTFTVWWRLEANWSSLESWQIEVISAYIGFLWSSPSVHRSQGRRGCPPRAVTVPMVSTGQDFGDCCVELNHAVDRLASLSAQDALQLLQISFTGPRVQHLLRCSPPVDNPDLETFEISSEISSYTDWQYWYFAKFEFFSFDRSPNIYGVTKFKK